MTVAQLWRYLGPLAVVVVPILLFAAPQGIPSGTWWDAPGDPAVWITAALTVFAVAEGVLSLKRAPEEARSTIRRDIESLARRAFVPINAHLPDVRVNQLGVHVWATDGNRLKRVVKYTMEQQRAQTPIGWERGKGAIGLAWDQLAPLVADLADLYAAAERLDPAAFEALEPGFRYGLSAEEVRRGGKYKSILAYPLTDEDNEVIGVLSVDCTADAQADRLGTLLDDRHFQDVLGSCESALRRYMGR